MKRIIFLFFICFFCTSCSSLHQARLCFPGFHYSNAFNDVKIRINNNGIKLKQGRNVYKWKEEFLGIKKVLLDDIDGDRQQEYIICTMLHDEEGFPDGYIFICKREGKKLKIRQRIRMYCNFRDAQTREITDDNAVDLIIYGSGGVHCDYLQIYSFREGRLITLFDKSSSAGIEFKFDEDCKSQIWVGRENWDDPYWCYATGRRLWEVHVWNGREFEYSKELSTSPLLSQGQHIEKVKEYFRP